MLAFMRFDAELFLKEKAALFFTIALPILLYLFFSLMFGNYQYEGGKFDFYDQYTISFAAMIMLSNALLGIGPTIVIYKEMGFFRRLLVTPLDMASVAASTIVRSTLCFLIGYAGMMLTGFLMFKRLPTAPIVELLAATGLASFCLISMGFLLGSAFKSANAAFNAGMLIFQPMLLLSGASFPLEAFPRWLQIAAQSIPMTHAVQVLRLSWRGELFTMQAVAPTLYLLAFGVFFTLVARRLFRWSVM